jgi:hypothetical protein
VVKGEGDGAHCEEVYEQGTDEDGRREEEDRFIS